ncbi:dTDP-4-dehydrorhamnose reductase [Halorubrum salinum]|uniref:dTDP-4-dehydrorhamnose reductase n=1 Tax=Halorubrum salinum TaxID=767517 RepID=UPI002110FB22|nr:dTDP-4-dehydrorhamnose reductase [Halorubrum salinum]
MRLLVVGANGLLGSNVVHAGRRRGWSLCGTYHSTRPDFEIPLSALDLRSPERFSDILAEYEPDAVINCAAMTDVDGCDSNPELAHALNSEGPQRLALDCRNRDIEFVHVSTDYVFDGTKRDPYCESDRPNPQQVYGESKLAGEESVMATMSSALVVRLAFVWGVHRSEETITGFPAWIRDKLQEDVPVPVFSDQWVTPTRAGHAAEAILDLLAADHTGITHVASSSCITPYEFGRRIAERLGASESSLVSASTESVERAAARPAYSCLDVQKVESLLGRPQPTIEDDLNTVDFGSSADQI